VFCEASAHGLPVITTDVGGVGEAVRTGENGVALPIEAGAADYADVIESHYDAGAGYRQLVVSTREAFDVRLNWDVWGREVAAAMLRLVA
jgi:glycosyltransferase involved in cell wall biosynthesis